MASNSHSYSDYHFPFGIAGNRRCRQVLPAIAVVFVCVITAVAIPTGEYHSNIRQAVTALDTLAQVDETESNSAYETRRNETFTGVRRLVPKDQTIESGDETFNIDNSWLHDELDKLNNASSEERSALLKQTTERLQALEQRLDEFEKASANRSNDKEAASRKLKEILARSEYAVKPKGQSAISKLMERILKWFQGLFPKPKPLAPGKAGIFSKIAQVLVVALALGVLIVVLKMFIPRLLRNRKPKKKKVKAEPRIVLGETLAPDQSARDLLAEAEALARAGELRAAIRKAYIALLVELGDRKILHLAEHKTNRDYLSAIYSHPPLYGNVRQLTDSFERHWYGLAQASETDWEMFRTGYKKTLG